MKTTYFYFLKQLLFFFCDKWVVALEHYVEENTEGPHVGVDWNVITSADDLWSHVGGSTTEGING
jgi:hypothetical protein